jgi:hypothetical protein
MIRHAAAVAVVMLLSPAWLSAERTTLTITTASANVHKAPSTGSAVVGQATRGAVLTVTRELGSWVKVSWPAAPDGVGYVHVSWGPMSNSALPDAKRAAASAPVRVPESALSAAAAAPADHARTVDQPAPARAVYVSPATHGVGLGARMAASPIGFGITVRGWRRNRLGMQLDVSRYASTSLTTSRVTAIQIAPSLLYSLPDRVTDYLWLRPYVGSGAMLHRASNTATPGAVPVPASGLGLQTFGGGEVTFAGAPQFAVSADLGYRWYRTPTTGFDGGGLGVSVLGHWYLK